VTYDFNHSRSKRESVSEAIVARIDVAMQAASLNEAPRAYNVSPSLIGDECLRRVQFETTRVPAGPHNGRLLRIFGRGHTFEPAVLEYLQAAGFVISGAGEDGRQHGFSVAKGQVRGRLDGIVMSGPEIAGLIYPCIWENKVLGAKGYRAVVKDGVAKAYPKYADQIALYQAYMEYTAPALFSVLCADTMDLYFEVVAFDAERAQAASDRAVQVLQANAMGELLARGGGDPDAFPCRFCRFKDHCWADGTLGPVRRGA